MDEVGITNGKRERIQAYLAKPPRLHNDQDSLPGETDE